MITYHYNSPLGGITLAAEDDAITGLWFDGQKYFADILHDEHVIKNTKGHEIMKTAKNWLDIYFSGHAPDFTPKLKFLCTDFRREVYEILLTIPFGKTMTYSDIAKTIAKNRGESNFSSRAVGGAVAHNSISLIVPCHRVIGKNRSLTGYSGGLDKKQKLLQLEGIKI